MKTKTGIFMAYSSKRPLHSTEVGYYINDAPHGWYIHFSQDTCQTDKWVSTRSEARRCLVTAGAVMFTNTLAIDQPAEYWGG